MNNEEVNESFAFLGKKKKKVRKTKKNERKKKEKKERKKRKCVLNKETKKTVNKSCHKNSK